MTTKKPIPPTTDEQCIKYRSGMFSCLCPDKKHGGSYEYAGIRICKHNLHQIMKAYKVWEKYETTLKSCMCDSFRETGFQDCNHIKSKRRFTDALVKARDPITTKQSAQKAINNLYGGVA